MRARSRRAFGATWFRVGLQAAALLAASAGASGCLWFWREEFIEPRCDIRDKRVLLVEFAEGELWYGESAIGRELHRALLYSLQTCSDTDIASVPDVEQQIYDHAGSSDPPWTEVGKRTESDLVLFGEVASISFEDRKLVGMLQGKMTVAFTVWNVEQNRAMFQHNVAATFPKDAEAAAVQVGFEQTEPEVRKRLVTVAATEIRKLLCGHKVSKAEQQRQ